MNKLEISLPDLPFAAEEAMNRLRINVKFCGQQNRKILVTSSIPNEGKSSVAVQLWRMMAEAGFKSVFVDLDLRKSVIRTRYGIASEAELKGLSYYLSGLAEYDDIIYQTNYENGYMVPCANALENPTLLFEDPQFEVFLNRLAEDYRYVIIDSPPLLTVSDGTAIASVCDGAILVVRSGYTSKKMIHDSINQLQNAGCRLLGTVLNRVGGNGYGRYGYGYGYGYDYGYGYGQEDSKEKE